MNGADFDSRCSPLPVHPERGRQKYQGLQSLLGENSRLLERMADLEGDLRFLALGSPSLGPQIQSLLDGTLLMIEDLNQLNDNRFAALYRTYRKVEREIQQELRACRKSSSPPVVVLLSQVGIDSEGFVGGKAARLGEVKKGFPDLVPEGFIITVRAHQELLSTPPLAGKIRPLLNTLEVSENRERFHLKAAQIREMIENTPAPLSLEKAIQEHALALGASSQNWAVRSSALGEDGSLSFAGQFETLLNVPTPHLTRAYQKVLASHFRERAISYRLARGLAEAETLMAVIIMPTVSARSSGVLYTRDPNRPEEEAVILSSTWGMAADLVANEAPSDSYRVDRRDPSRILESTISLKETRLVPGGPSSLLHERNTRKEQRAPSLGREEVMHLVSRSLEIEKFLGAPQDIEWAFDLRGKLWILQARPLRFAESLLPDESPVERNRPILTGGFTIFPGRAVAPAQVISNSQDISALTPGMILVLARATPDISVALPHLAGLIAEKGHPTSHTATLLRESAIPSLFEVYGATQKLTSGTMISLDASHRQVFLGILWPEIRQRTMARLARPKESGPSSPLASLILNLRMTDPLSGNFRPEKCRSIHDLVRFTHEKAVSTLFEIGDKGAMGKERAAQKLASPIPLDLFVRDLGNALDPRTRCLQEVSPEDIRSLPFQALWRGIAHPRLNWAGRRQVNLRGFASVAVSSLAPESGGTRNLGAPNYLLVAPDYMNFNARLAYHFAMIDSLIGPAAENNYVNFRFRGGASRFPRRELRARFLAEVLLQSRFHADRRGDLVTAWLRQYPQKPSEDALELLGKLMACARQLDMLMEDESIMRHFVSRFLAEDYEAFA